MLRMRGTVGFVSGIDLGPRAVHITVSFTGQVWGRGHLMGRRAQELALDVQGGDQVHYATALGSSVAEEAVWRFVNACVNLTTLRIECFLMVTKYRRPPETLPPHLRTMVLTGMLVPWEAVSRLRELRVLHLNEVPPTEGFARMLPRHLRELSIIGTRDWHISVGGTRFSCFCALSATLTCVCVVRLDCAAVIFAESAVAGERVRWAVPVHRRARIVNARTNVVAAMGL